MAAVHDLLEALSSMGITIEARNGSLRYRPRSAMTPDLLEAVKNCKEDLLKILPDRSLLLNGLGGSGSRSPGAASTTQASPTETLAQTPADGESRADIEFARFEEIAQPMPGGGWFDPINGSSQMPSGIPGADWDALLATGAKLRRRRERLVRAKARRRRPDTGALVESVLYLRLCP